MSFRLVPKLVTLNDPERRNGRYIALFHWIWYTYVPKHNRRVDLCQNLCTNLLYFVVRVRCRRKESSRSLSHLLMSFLLHLQTYETYNLKFHVNFLNTIFANLPPLSKCHLVRPTPPSLRLWWAADSARAPIRYVPSDFRPTPLSGQIFQIHSPGGSAIYVWRPFNRLSASIVLGGVCRSTTAALRNPHTPYTSLRGYRRYFV